VPEPNGTYAFSVGVISGFQASPSSGNVRVDGGAVQQTIAFSGSSSSVFNVTFKETGLPGGTMWSVTLAGVLLNTTTTQMTFLERNGTYAFSVENASGYKSSPGSGNVSVAGSPDTITLSFSKLGPPPPEYALVFNCSGLPGGLNWSVWVGGAQRSTILNLIILNEPNGTYNYTVTPPSGYVTNRTTGIVTIKGAPQTVAINFTKGSNQQSNPSFLSGIAPYFWYLVVAALLILALLCILVLARRRRREEKGYGVGPEPAAAATVTAPKNEWDEDDEPVKKKGS
jgi:hypothetical protein